MEIAEGGVAKMSSRGWCVMSDRLGDLPEVEEKLENWREGNEIKRLLHSRLCIDTSEIRQVCGRDQHLHVC